MDTGSLYSRWCVSRSTTSTFLSQDDCALMMAALAGYGISGAISACRGFTGARVAISETPVVVYPLSNGRTLYSARPQCPLNILNLYSKKLCGRILQLGRRHKTNQVATPGKRVRL